jgi:translation initiation factor IF-3
MPPTQALMLAEEKGLDLVEIAATANPPVCRIMNSGKFFYQQAKRDAEARKHQRHIKIKEVKFRPKVDEHDFAFKRRNVERFLLDGNKVKSLVIFRGREIVHSEIGREILNRLAVELGDTVLIESPPRQEGNTMVQILAPKKEVPVKPKGQASEKKGDGKKEAKGEAKAEAKKAAGEPKAARAAAKSE